MGNNRILRAAVIATLLAAPLAAQAQVTNEELLKRIEEQDQKIKTLERKLEIGDEAAAAAKEATPVVAAGPKGFSLKSADGKNQIRLRGTLHLDYRNISGTDPGGTFDTFVATRVRPTIEGTFASIYDFKFMPDFGQGRTVIQDAYVNARFKPGAQVQLGKFKAPIGLERLQSANDMRWVQRGFPTSLVTNRDIGVQFAGDVGGRALLVPGRLPQRLERRRQQRDLHGPRHQQRQGIRASPLHAAVRGERQLRAPRSRLRHRRLLHRPGRHGAAAAPARLPHARPVDVLPFPGRRHGPVDGRGDDRGRRAHPHRAAGVLLRRQPRHPRRVHRGLAGRLARGPERDPRGDRRHQRLAVCGLVLPDGRRGDLQGLPAEDALLAERGHLGRIRDQGPRAAAERRRQRLRRRRRFVCRPGCVREPGRLVRDWPKLVPQREREVAARLRAHDLRGRRCRWARIAGTRTPTSSASRSVSEHGEWNHEDPQCMEPDRRRRGRRDVVHRERRRGGNHAVERVV